MKNFFLYLLIILAINSCIQTDKSKEQSADAMSVSLATNVIKVPYDSAYVEVCDDTQRISIPYDSTYLRDTCESIKRVHRNGYWKKCYQVLDTATGHRDSLVIFCHTDTLQGTKDSILPPPPPPATIFGAKISKGTFLQHTTALKALGVNVVRPTSITLSTWVAGSKIRLDEFLNAGYTCIVNVNWDEQTPNTIIPFTTNLTLYATRFEALVKQYAQWAKDGKLIWAIENEEVNKTYFSGPIENYIAILNTAVSICVKYDAPLTDGSVAEEFTNMIATNTITARYVDQTTSISKLIVAFKAITYKKFYVNIHRMFTGSSYTGNDITVVCDYLRAQTGHEVLSNEHHFEYATTQLVSDVETAFKKAGVKYCLVYDEDKGQGGAITNGDGTLTTLGKAFAAAIK